MRLETASALAWRWRRHALDHSGGSAVEVIDRVVATRGWPAHLADLTVGVRQADPQPQELAAALRAGALIRSYALRGGSYVFTPKTAAALLAVRTTTRVWETRRYQRQGGFALDDWDPLREVVRDRLADGPATRAQIGAALQAVPSLRHLTEAATGTGSDSLYKPLHWWGDICFGPTTPQGQATFRLLRADPDQADPPDLDMAGRAALRHYLAGYAPATLAGLDYWFAEGLSVPRARLRAWLADLGEEVATVQLGADDAYILTEDLVAVRSAEPVEQVRLIPAYDPWVMGPGTADTRLLDPKRRGLASRGAALVLRGGVVTGTWRRRGEEVVVSWFEEAGSVPVEQLEGEIARLGRLEQSALALRLG